MVPACFAELDLNRFQPFFGDRILLNSSQGTAGELCRLLAPACFSLRRVGALSHEITGSHFAFTAAA